MNNLVLFILGTAGLSWILTQSELFRSMREFFSRKKITRPKNYIYWFIGSLFSCCGCMGFWSGMFNFVVINRELDLDIIVYGFIGSISSLILISLHKFLERK